MWLGTAVTSSTLHADPPSNETIDVFYIKMPTRCNRGFLLQILAVCCRRDLTEDHIILVFFISRILYGALRKSVFLLEGKNRASIYLHARCNKGFYCRSYCLKHVSSTTMPIIRSSRVLYSGCCLWYSVLWFFK